MAGPRDLVRELTDRYDRAAEVYEELWAPILRSAALPLARELNGGAVDRVLDVGAGVGALLPDLSSFFPGASVLGVDRSHGMLARAPQRFGRALMDANALAVRADSVDRVLFVFMLFHLEDPGVALREARRVLRSGGSVGTLTWANDLQSKAGDLWAECLDRNGAAPPDPATESRHENVDMPAKMEALLLAAGFHSPRSWEDDLVVTIDADPLIRLKTNLGQSRLRFDSLSSEAAAACRTEARSRMRSLAPEDFVSRAKVVYATASR